MYVKIQTLEKIMC